MARLNRGVHHWAIVGYLKDSKMVEVDRCEVDSCRKYQLDFYKPLILSTREFKKLYEYKNEMGDGLIVFGKR